MSALAYPNIGGGIINPKHPGLRPILPGINATETLRILGGHLIPFSFATGALSGLPSNTRALPGMLAPTNQESPLVRSKFAPASETSLVHVSSASEVAEICLTMWRMWLMQLDTHSTPGSQPLVKLPAPAPGIMNRLGNPAFK
ncbi:MAG: hypothetical protein CM1200mP22_32280 [Dehalococcoidia bacterium]|nr:MAG: hypothetical protein CM1200mP22_32280 [Dehalococcoidia bacterium]